MLHIAASTLAANDEPTKEAIGHLDGLSVHMLKFGDLGVPDENAVNSMRDAYHLRGWKHVVTSTNHGGPVHNGNTDVWVVMDGVNVRGAVILAETPKSITLVTVAGDLSPWTCCICAGISGFRSSKRMVWLSGNNPARSSLRVGTECDILPRNALPIEIWVYGVAFHREFHHLQSALATA